MATTDERVSELSGLSVPVIAFAGRISSGKSSLAQVLASHIGAESVSFADYVRSRARSDSGPVVLPRRKLQELGASLAEDPQQFCDLVLRSATEWSPGRPLVVDGVRHVTILDALRTRCVPASVLLVYIDSAEGRREALLQAEGYTPEDIQELETHSTEQDVRWSLAGLANKVVRHGSLEMMLTELGSWLLETWPGAPADLTTLQLRAPELRKTYQAITSDELARRDPSGQAAPENWQAAGLVLAFVEADGINVFPEFQFSYEHRPYPVLADVIKAFRKGGYDDDAIYRWLVVRNPLLKNEIPADVLKRSEDVLAAAERFVSQGDPVPPDPGVLEPGTTRESTALVDESPRSMNIRQRWSGVVLDEADGNFLVRLVHTTTAGEALRWFTQAEIGGDRIGRGTSVACTEVEGRDPFGETAWLVEVQDDVLPERDENEARRLIRDVEAAIGSPDDVTS
jgi:hypothetical protein